VAGANNIFKIVTLRCEIDDVTEFDTVVDKQFFQPSRAFANCEASVLFAESLTAKTCA